MHVTCHYITNNMYKKKGWEGGVAHCSNHAINVCHHDVCHAVDPDTLVVLKTDVACYEAI